MGLGRNRMRGVLTLTLGLCICLVGLQTAADPTADQLADIAPLGASDGQVDSTDVEAAMRLAADGVAVDRDTTERGDVAPVTPLGPEDPIPQSVRPNPNPQGPLDIGDVVVIARRAAGLIQFGQLNASPVVSLVGDGDIVSLTEYQLTGQVQDDGNLEGATVQVLLDDTVVADNVPVGSDGSFTTPVVLQAPLNQVSAQAIDDEGRLGPVSSPIGIELDTQAPILTVDSPQEDFLTNQATVDFSGTVTDEHDVLVLVNGIEAILVPPNLWGVVDLPLDQEGKNTVDIIAQDVANPANQTQLLTHTVIRDTQVPVVSLDAVASPVNTQQVTLSGTFSDEWGIASVIVGGVRGAFGRSQRHFFG